MLIRSLFLLALSLSLAGPARAQSQAPEPPSLERGAELWGKCRACHTLEPKGRHTVGPNLSGMFGRVAGSLPDYRYSEAMRKSGVIWTEANLDAYLAATQDFMPGSKMYGGLAIPQDRADLLFWLRAQTGGPAR